MVLVLCACFLADCLLANSFHDYYDDDDEEDDDNSERAIIKGNKGLQIICSLAAFQQFHTECVFNRVVLVNRLDTSGM